MSHNDKMSSCENKKITPIYNPIITLWNRKVTVLNN